MLFAPEVIPIVSKRDIKDRSKSDWLAKLLAIGQVLFFIVSCAIRRAQSLPLTLFEVVTLSRAVCAIVTYAMWFKKPLDIGVPTVLDSEYARDLGALFVMASPANVDHITAIAPMVAQSEWHFIEVVESSSTEVGRFLRT